MMLVFQEPVMVLTPENISLIFYPAAYNENGTAATLAAAEAYTVDGQFNGRIPAFAVDARTHSGIMDAVATGGGLRVAIGAVYSAEGFSDVAMSGGREVPLVADVPVLR